LVPARHADDDTGLLADRSDLARVPEAERVPTAVAERHRVLPVDAPADPGDDAPNPAAGHAAHLAAQPARHPGHGGQTTLARAVLPGRAGRRSRAVLDPPRLSQDSFHVALPRDPP